MRRSNATKPIVVVLVLSTNYSSLVIPTRTLFLGGEDKRSQPPESVNATDSQWMCNVMVEFGVREWYERPTNPSGRPLGGVP